MYLSQHLLSCSKHRAFGFLRGHNRKGPGSLPSADLNLQPNRLCASCKEKEFVNTPLPGHGLTWADPAQGRGPSGRSSAHRGHRPAPPACLLTRADPEPLRARPGLTESRSWKARDPGLRSVRPPNSRTCRGFCCAGHRLHPPPLLSWTPGLLSLAGLFETASHLRAR